MLLERDEVTAAGLAADLVWHWHWHFGTDWGTCASDPMPMMPCIHPPPSPVPLTSQVLAAC